MALKDLLKINEVATGLGDVQQIVALVAAAGPIPFTLWSDPNSIEQNILAAIYQDDDAHGTCSLTACLNPLHPGPCKGWKGTLHSVSPGAWHALEAARVEKANHARVKKIEALKAQGKPIPHKLLQPILPKAHPNAGQTAKQATGEAHAAGKAVSDSAGITNNHPGKVTLGQAVKSVGPVEKGPKGKKPTLGSKGIAFVIGQEKVTPQYKLDKAAAITPEQWSGLSGDDKASIRGELAKIQKDGFGPQQKKATELLGKLKNEPELKPGTPGTITTPSGKVYQKISLKEIHEAPAPSAPSPVNPPKAQPPKVVQMHEQTHAPKAPKLVAHQEPVKPGSVKKSIEDAAKAAHQGKLLDAIAKVKAKENAEAIAKQSARAAEDTAKGRAHLEEAAAKAAEAKPKPLPKHVTDAIAMAEGKAPGASWSKNHLAAYQPLSAEEFGALPLSIRTKIVDELTKGKSKFLDPKKVAAAQALLEKFGHGEGAPKAIASPKLENVTFAEHLHDHGVTAAQAKKAVADTLISTHFKVAKQTAGLTDLDNPSSGLHVISASDDAEALVALKTKLYDKAVLGQPDVKLAMSNLETAAIKQSYAQAVQDAKSRAFNKISLTLAKDKGELSPIEKASLLHYAHHVAGLANPPTSASDLDKLKADTKQAENELNDKLHAALKKANAPKADDMSPAQIEDRATELLGPLAAHPKTNLSLAEMQNADKMGKAQVAKDAEKYPEKIFNDPTVLAKMGSYASISTQILASKAEIHHLQDHIKTLHMDAVNAGTDQHGNPLTVDDKAVIAKHAIMLGESHAHLGKTLEALEKKYPEVKAAFHDAAAKAQGGMKPAEPVKLSDYDQTTISDAYANAWGKHASKAVTYGIKSYSDSEKMKAHPQYPGLTQDLGNLKALAGKLALAHAQEHTAKQNVPTNPVTGDLEQGPEHQAWYAAFQHRNDLTSQFSVLHKQAQTKLDTIRTDAGLKKRALPKLDTAAVKATAAESGYYKTTGYSGPNYGKPSSGKKYLLSKVGPKLAVAHQTANEKKLEKLGATAGKAPSTTKIENATPAPAVKLGGGPADSSIAHIPDPLKKQITSDFKGMPKGKYLADPTEDIFDNLVNLAAGHGKTVPGGLSVDQVLKTIDETHSKNLGAVNSGMLHKKVTDWLGTSAGKTYAEQHSTPDAKVVKQISGELDLPKGVTLAPGEKVQKLAGPGPHDPGLESSAFKAATAQQAQEAQDAYMKASGTKWSAQQKSSLKAYTGSAYSLYNGYLRGNGTTSQNIKQDIIDIQSAMMPLPQHTLLKRGTGWPPELAGFQSDPKKLLGKTFEEPGFTSTTVAGSGGHFSGQSLQLVIEAPAGTPAAFVNGISHFKNQENEMLLAAGTKFKVLSVDKTTAGHTLLRVRIVGDK